MTDSGAISRERAKTASLASGALRLGGQEPRQETSSASPSAQNPLGGLLSLETAVLRAFCLAINTSSASTARRIAAGLDRACFYFPVTRSIFTALTALESTEALITPTSLEQELRDHAVGVPSDFFLEDLFMGELPEPEALGEWMATLRGRRVLEHRAGLREAEAAGGLAQTHPSMDRGVADPVAELDEVEGSSAMALLVEHTNVSPFPTVGSSRSSNARRSKPEPSTRESTPPSHLSPESKVWPSYLAALTDRQGEWLQTGFEDFDTAFGGLGPGVAHLVGGEPETIRDFLKQLVDQVAAGSTSRCLYVSFERTGAELRLSTLARLTQESSRELAAGRYDRRSPRWKRVLKAGEAAMDWLSRVYVADHTADSPDGSRLATSRLARICAEFRSTDEPSLDLVVIDNVHRVEAAESGQTFSELRNLASTLGLAIVVAQTRGPHTDVRDDEVSLVFEAAARSSERILRCAGHGESARLRFDYQASTHRFFPQQES